MSRLRRILRPSRRRVLITTAVVFATISLGISILLGTSPGARFVFGQVLSRLPVQVEIDHIDGRLWGPLFLEGIHVEAPGAVVDIDTVQLDWAPVRLLSRTLRVERFEVDGVQGRLVAMAPQAEQAAEEPKPQPAGLPHIPIDIIIDEAKITRVSMLLAEEVRLADLQFSMSGTPDDYSISFSTNLEGEAVPPTSVALEAQGGMASARLDSLHVRTLEGALVAYADLQWYPELTWNADVVADSLRPGLLAADPEQWAGRIGTRLHTEGSMQDGLPTGTAAIDTIAGDLRGHPIAGSGTASFAGAERVDADFKLQWSSVHMQVRGALGDSLVAAIDLACGSLGELLPGAEGSVTLQAAVDGMRNTPRANGDLQVDGLLLPANQLGLAHADAHFEVDTAQDMAGLVQLNLDSLVAGTTAIDRSTLELSGDRGNQRLRLAATGPELELLLAVQGTLGADSLVWTGSIDTLRAANPVAGTWSLADPAHVMASRTAASLDSLRLESGAASMGLSGRWDPSGWAARGNLLELPLAVADANLPEGRRLDGVANLHFDATGEPDGQLRANVTAALEDARFVYPSGDSSDSLLFQDAQLSATVADSGTTAEMAVVVTAANGPASMSLTGQASLPGLNSIHVDPQSQTLTASVDGDLPDLGVFDEAAEALESLAGAITLRLDASGTLASPTLDGAIDATGIQVSVPELGLKIHDAELHARNESGKGFSLNGRAVSGEGQIEITGNVPQHPSAESPATATLVGDRFEGMNTPEVALLISPDMAVRYDGTRMDVTGTFLVPLLQIELVEVPESAVPVSRDVVIVEEEAEETKAPIDTWIDMQLVLGEDVWFRGFGADMEMEGQLAIKQHLPKPPQARGEIRITKGRYTAYGQDLDFERGVLSFVGPPTNPNLDMRAARTAPDGTIAGLLITGTAENPELQIYSEPAMSDTDAISYLLTGRPMDAGTGDDRARVGGAAALLGSNMISNRLGSKVGLDEARVETDGTVEESSLVAGKYITPDLFLSYAMGLFDRSNLVRLRYTLTPRWAVQTETGTTQGADVFYTIEFGGH